MLKLKTNTGFTIPSGRGGTKEVIIRLIVDSVYFDKNAVKVNGYYYYYDKNNEVMKLDDFGASSLVERAALEYLEENVLSVLPSTKDTYENLIHRIKEMTLMQIEQEAPENYGTYAADWVDDVEAVEL